jgi:hypothetical protein
MHLPSTQAQFAGTPLIGHPQGCRLLVRHVACRSAAIFRQSGEAELAAALEAT